VGDKGVVVGLGPQADKSMLNTINKLKIFNAKFLGMFSSMHNNNGYCIASGAAGKREGGIGQSLLRNQPQPSTGAPVHWWNVSR
jgi:hypothetical protein